MPSPFVNLILDFATQTTLALVKTTVDAIEAKLPAAPATEGKQDTGNASLSSIDGKLPSVLASDRLKVDGSGVTQPVSDAGGSLTVDGGVTATQGTAAAANAPWFVRLSDGSAALSVALDATVQAVRDRLPSSLGAGGGVKVDGSGTALPVSASALPLPTGAATETTLASVLAKIIAAPATEAKQDTGNTSLSTLAGVVSAGKALVTETSAAAILAKFTGGQAARASSLGVTLSTEDAAKVPSLGQALAAGSVPVVLPAAQAGGALALDATLTGGTARAGVLGADGSTIATTSNRLPCSLGSAVTTAGNAGTSANLTAGSDYGGTPKAYAPKVDSSGLQYVTSAQLPDALGCALAAKSLTTVRAIPSLDEQATLATAGKVVKASAGMAYIITYYNNTGATIYIQIHNKTAAPTSGDRPCYFSSAIPNGTKSTLSLGAAAAGQACPTGITLAISSTQDTFTAQGSTAFPYAMSYD